jgi:hypothetical protein
MPDEKPQETPNPNEGQQTQEERLLAGKYKTPEELEVGYKELVKKLGQQGKLSQEDVDKFLGIGSPNQEKKDEQQNQQTNEKKAEQVVTNAGLDFQALSQEFMENGTLSDESYERLEKANIPRDVVDAYIAGQVALAEKLDTEIFNLVGGEKRYDEMVLWARQNLTESERKAFDATISSASPDQIKLAVNGLKTRWESATGIRPYLLQGDGASPSVGGRYESREQMIADMKNPLYKKDPAFRKAVEQKIKNSPNLF